MLKFLSKWNEFLTIPIAIILWYFSPTLLHWLDPTAATFDAGIFQMILFTVIQFLIYHGVAWFVLKITFPTVYNYIDNIFEKNLNSQTSWPKKQSAKFALFLFALYFIGIILLARAV